MTTIKNLKVKDENGVEKLIRFGYDTIEVTDSTTLKDLLQKNPDGGYYPVDNSIMDEIENVEQSIGVIDENTIRNLFSKE